MASQFITFLATARIAFGSLSFLAPAPTLSLFRLLPPSAPLSLPSPTGTALLATRMFGVRDAVLGGLLYTADSPAAVRRALVAGAVVDGIDVLGCVWAVWNGDVEMLAADLVGGGALVFFAMGLWGLRRAGGLVGKGGGK
jgi:hypothetical protein